jgi:hypothetical protein
VPVHRTLTCLVAAQGVGALALAVLWFSGAEFLGEVGPRAVAALPLGLAVGAFTVVRTLIQRHRWRFVYVFVVQEVVLVAAVIGLVFSGHGALWLALATSLAGTALIRIAMLEEERFGDNAVTG